MLTPTAISRPWLCLLAIAALGAPADTAAVQANDAVAGACPDPDETAGEPWPGARRWQRLEDARYRLGELRIEIRDVYTGTSLPWYQRLANSLHPETHAEVIRSLLTIAPGERVTAARIHEAERVLRSQSFLTHARIVPVHCDGERVAAEVRVRDAWTLQLGASFGHAGGESNSSVGFQDENFLGSGKTVLLEWSEGRERTTLEVGYEDRAVLGSPWTLSVSHSELSDGRSEALAVSYPFRTADQPWALRSSLEDGRSELDFREGGKTAYTADVESHEAYIEALRLIHRGTGSGWRAGLGWDRDYADYGELDASDPSLRPPPVLPDRRLQGPYMVAERFSTRYRSFRNLRAIGKTEDYALGLDSRLLTGRYIDGGPWFYSATVHHGMPVGTRDLLLAGFEFSGRYSDKTGERAAYRSALADFYHRTSRRNTVVVHGELDWRDDLDPEDELYLGGFDGLLAYPDYFRSGDRRWQLHLEDRYVSDTILFDTIQLGYTAYLEAGGVRGFDGEWGRTLADMGAGLRLGSLRSSFGSVSYVTLAVPLVDVGNHDDFSIVIGSTVEF